MGVRGTANPGFEGRVRVSRNNPSADRKIRPARIGRRRAALLHIRRPFRGGQPRSAFDWGYRLRLRQEYGANLSDFSNALADDNNYLRVRSQLWGSWAPAAQWKLYAMLNNEHRRWYKSNKGLEDRPFEIHELIFENLYIEGKNLGGTPFGFVAGRQNLFYGEGFICWDGGPLDGSRTAYFNALLLTASFGKRRLEAHFISDPEQDEYLPVFNDQDQPLIEWDETGAGLYYTDESFESRKLEAYYFYKNENDADNVYPESDIHTIGARASGKGFERFTFAVEAAAQFGDRGAQDRLGYGGYLYGKYSLPVDRAPVSLVLGAFYLSGDSRERGFVRGMEPGLFPLAEMERSLHLLPLEGARSGLLGKHRLAAVRHRDQAGQPRHVRGADLSDVGARAAPSGPRHIALRLGKLPRDAVDHEALRRVETYLSAYVLWEALLPGDYYLPGKRYGSFSPLGDHVQVLAGGAGRARTAPGARVEKALFYGTVQFSVDDLSGVRRDRRERPRRAPLGAPRAAGAAERP